MFSLLLHGHAYSVYQHGLTSRFRHALHLGSRERYVQVVLRPDDIAYLQYTGGTTGQAKGAMLSHGNILANISQALGMYGNIITRGEEKVLTALPLYHIFAHTINLMLFFAAVKVM